MSRTLTRVAALLIAGVSSAAGAEPCLKIVERQTLPAELEWVADVRWAGTKSVFVSAPLAGVYVDRWDDPEAAELVEPRSRSRHGVWIPKVLGVSDDYVVVAAPVFAYGWKPRAKKTLEAVHAFANVSDLDVHANRIALLGAQRDDDGRYAPDGAIAWVGPVDQEPDELEPVYFSVSGPGAWNISACAMMDVGTVRFLADGSLLILPGVEPDVHRFSRDGRLMETWSSEAVGFDAECDISEEQMYKLSVDEPGRWAWVNGRRTVDEILPLADAPGVLVRTVEDDTTSWRLRRLRPGGAVDTCEVPLTVGSKLAHVRGDVRGDEVVLLLFYQGYSRQTPHPPAHPELLRLLYEPP